MSTIPLNGVLPILRRCPLPMSIQLHQPWVIFMETTVPRVRNLTLKGKLRLSPLQGLQLIRIWYGLQGICKQINKHVRLVLHGTNDFTPFHYLGTSYNIHPSLRLLGQNLNTLLHDLGK